MTPEETLDWLAQQHFDQCREERPIQDWIRKMKSQLPVQPAVAEQHKQSTTCGEPLEYWNAVEGWVKIDEVREHFDSVGCGTIYKTSGEGRVPLSLCKAQPAVAEQHKQGPVASCNGMPAYEGPLSKTQRKQLTQDLDAPLTLNGVALYPQSKPLPKKQIDEMANDGDFAGNVYEITRAIEAAHGITEEKNNGSW